MSKKMPKAATKKTASAPKKTALAKGALLATGLALLAIFTFSLLAAGWHYSNCQEKYRQDVVISQTGRTLYAQEATTNAEKVKGLGDRACLPADQGMLFIFDQPGYYPFWAKDMRFSIDIIWISQDKRVVDIEPSVTPESYPKIFTNSHPAKYVLEIGSGAAYGKGLTPGTQLNF